MEHLDKAVGQIRTRVWMMALGAQILVGSICLLLYRNNYLTDFELIILFTIGVFVSSFLISFIAGSIARIPLFALGNVILHVSPSENAVAPQTDNLAIGREYVTSLAYQLYQIATLQDNKLLAEHKREATQASNILNHIPLPLFVFNKQQIVTFGSDAALSYCGIDSAQLLGKPLFDAADFEFGTEFTLESWINDCQQNKATDLAYWRRVRLRLRDDKGTLRQCDMAGYYNRDNPSGIEFIVTLFDRTDEYEIDDKSLNFIALGVHELRTPLTLMRGYIEVFEDELEGKLDPEMTEFMHRMHGASQQLTTFVNNILNVAKIEENQLTVQLAEHKWDDIVKHAGSDMELRAKALGKNLTYQIDSNLPTVAVDRMTIYEVICNLLDNAIKYSGDGVNISLKSILTTDGLIETKIHNDGAGIPTAVIPSLFEKYHRNHRNKAQVGGTGLGLYLSKAIVTAHGGSIWIKSKEGEGTEVGFTLRPYAQLADELKTSNNKDAMIRTAHGWIKNHSLYRR